MHRNDVIRAVGHELITAGANVVLGDPHAEGRWAKMPLDMRGDTAEGPGGWHANTDNHDIFDTWVDTANNAQRDLNVGLAITGEPGGIIVVDLDTQRAVDQWNALADDNDEPREPLTVLTPGKKNDQGAWVHRHGGHVYYRTPTWYDPQEHRGTTIINPASDTTEADQVAIKMHSSWVLVPPSTRAEGSYKWNTPDNTMPEIRELPLWLMDEIEYVKPRKARKASAYSMEDTQRAIEQWEPTISWDEILSEFGWTVTSDVDKRCGCRVVSRPGGASSRSGIAHEDCSQGQGHVLHVFSDADDTEIGRYLNSRGISRISKLDCVALSRYGGRRRWAMVEEGIIGDSGEGRKKSVPAGVDEYWEMVRQGTPAVAPESPQTPKTVTRTVQEAQKPPKRVHTPRVVFDPSKEPTAPKTTTEPALPPGARRVNDDEMILAGCSHPVPIVRPTYAIPGWTPAWPRT